MKIIKHKSKIYTNHIKNILFANNCRKALIKIGIYSVFFGIAALIALIPNILKTEKKLEAVRFTTDLKYILFWKDHHKKIKRNFYTKDAEFISGQTQFIQQNCPYINCYITYNKSLLRTEEDFDAIVFSVNNIKKLSVYNMNLGRSENQIYIFKSQDPPEHHPVCNPLYDNFFNWTWTYKLNSDIAHTFINIHDTNNNLIGPARNIEWVKHMAHTDKHKKVIEGKSKAIAWLVTNCKLKSKHEDFVKELRGELKGYNYSIDLFGPCSERKCPKGGIVKCFKNIERDYFFTLVLEDSFAKDYVTEKMVKGMTYLSVPIVNGFTNYTNFLPPGSYINARSFGLKKLGAVLDYLMKNREKYSYFFDWKDYYYFSSRPRTYICDLCTKLNENNKKKSYKEIRRWWNPEFEDTCQKLELYNLFRDTP